MSEKKDLPQSKLIIVLASVIIVLLSLLLFTQASNNPFFSRLSGGKVVVAPMGTRLNISLVSSVSSGINRTGDVVSATVSSPIIIGEDIVVPNGSQVLGNVSSVVPAQRFKGGKGGYIAIRFTTIQTPDGKKYPINTSVYSVSGDTGGTRLAKGVAKTVIGAGAGAALGTAIGAIAGGRPGRGAWSGAAIGGGLGAAGAIVSKGKEATLINGAYLSVKLEQPLQVIAKK